MSEPEDQCPCWGDYELPADQTARWEIGPLRFWLQRSRAEWRLAHEWCDNEDSVDWKLFSDAVWPGKDVNCERFAVYY